tara:strand:+ start:92775 stop:93917 length:1143 start_codon:yes stop_codon:yes gene_type:complete
MQKHLIFLSAIIFVSILTSCLDEGKPDSKPTEPIVKQDSTRGYKRIRIVDGKSISQYAGKPGRLMIIADNGMYTDEIQQLFDSIFAKEIRPYYPKHPYFEIYQRTPKEFSENSKRLRNVIKITVSEKVPEGKPRMEVRKNYYAKTQLFTEIYAHDINELYTFLEDELFSLFKLYETQEWKREFYRHQRSKNQSTKRKLASKFGIRMELPDKFRYESIDDQYAIILLPDRSRQMEMKVGDALGSTKANFIQSGIMVWQYPFKDSSQMKPEMLMQKRDTILKYHAKHEIPGVYMGTQDHPAVLPEFERFKVNGIEGYQFRGLYKFTGRLEPSGGKFWSFHFKHPKRNTVVAVSGYLDAPPTMSASFDLNRIRAIIYSLKLVD